MVLGVTCMGDEGGRDKRLREVKGERRRGRVRSIG